MQSYTVHIICKTKCKETCCQHIENIQYEHRKRIHSAKYTALAPGQLQFHLSAFCSSAAPAPYTARAQNDHRRHILNLLRHASWRASAGSRCGARARFVSTGYFTIRHLLSSSQVASQVLLIFVFSQNGYPTINEGRPCRE